MKTKSLCAAILLVLLVPAFAMAGSLELISRAVPSRLSDTGGPGDGVPAAVSDDGRYVAIVSSADNLVPGQVDAQTGAPSIPFYRADVFLRDRVAGTTVLVSRSSASPTRTGNRYSREPSISADGRYVAFASAASDLVPGQVDDPGPVDNPLSEDVFLFDRTTGTVTLVSRAATSPVRAGNGYSWPPVISADGSLVAFASSASDLLPGGADGNGSQDVFLFERATGALSLVSRRVGQPGVPAQGDSNTPRFSADGRYVAFVSSAGNLVAGQSQNQAEEPDVFLLDRVAGTMALVSHTASSQTAGAGSGDNYALSADGRYVAFISEGDDLVPGQVQPHLSDDVYLYDRTDGAVRLVSHVPGAPAHTGDLGSGVGRLGISADGSYVVFASGARDLVPGGPDPDGDLDVFLYHRQDDTLIQVSDSASTSFANSGSPVISPDGRYVAYESDDRNLVPGQTVSFDQQVFLFDRLDRSNRLVSHTAGSSLTPGDDESGIPLLSAGAGTIAFSSAASDLAAGVLDLNHRTDAFAYDVATGTSSCLTLHAPGMASVSGDFFSVTPAVSADGRYVAFLSGASNLVPGYSPGSLVRENVYLFDRTAGVMTLVSHAAGSATTPAEGLARFVALSRDGNWLAFASFGTDVVPGQMNGNGAFSNLEIFLHDRAAGTAVLVSHAAGAPTTAGNGYCFDPAVSADGRYVAYTSQATDLIAGATDGNGGLDVFLYDRATGTNTLVSHADGQPATAGDGVSDPPALSADGGLVAFASTASNLVAGQGAVHGKNVFLYDRAAGTLTLVSHAAGSAADPAGGESSRPVLAAGGSALAFASQAGDLVPGFVGTGQDNVFLFDRAAGTVRLVGGMYGASAVEGNGMSRPGAVSDDGRYVAFQSQASDLISGVVDGAGTWDVFLFDAASGVRTLASRTARDSSVAAGGENPAMSADGRFVAFASQGIDLVPGQIDLLGTGDFFLWDRDHQTTELLTGAYSSPVDAGSGNGLGSVAVAANGGHVVFDSYAQDLVLGDFDFEPDVFLYSQEPPAGRSFFTLSPCRAFDTRRPADGPALGSGITRTVALHGVCGIPAGAVAVAANITIVLPTGTGHLTLHAGDQPVPLASTINFAPGKTRANNAVLPLALGGGGTLAITPFVLGGGSVNVIVDVTGYFE